jgi:hypothetical protein
MMKLIGNRIYALIGLVGAIITIVPFAVSDTVRFWARNHSNWLYGTLVLLVLAVTILLGYITDLNRKYRELDASRRKASDHDADMLREVLAQIPRDGAIMTWLKVDFFAKAMPSANIEALEKVQQKLDINPLEFDDRQVNNAYESLRSAIEGFLILLTRYCDFEEGTNYKRLRVRPPKRESEESAYYKEIEEIKESVITLTSAYDSFLKISKMNGLNIYSAAA